MPRKRGWSSTMMALASSVATTGAWIFSASRASASRAPQISAVCSATITGRRCGLDGGRGFLHRLGIRPRAERGKARVRFVHDDVEHAFVGGDGIAGVARHVDVHGTRRAGRRFAKRLPQHVRNLLEKVDAALPLGDRLVERARAALPGRRCGTGSSRRGGPRRRSPASGPGRDPACRRRDWRRRPTAPCTRPGGR